MGHKLKFFTAMSRFRGKVGSGIGIKCDFRANNKVERAIVMKSIQILVVAVLAFMVFGCENAELVSCQEQNQILTADLDQAKAENVKASEDFAVYKQDSEEMQTKAMQGITTMLQKQETVSKKLKASAAQAKEKAAKLAEQLEAAKKTQAALQGEVAELKEANADLKAELAEDDDDDDEDEGDEE